MADTQVLYFQTVVSSLCRFRHAAKEISYDELILDGSTTYFDLMQMLKTSITINGQRENLGPGVFCHLDPDIRPSVLKRKEGWKGLFGQIDAAQGHLENQGVCPDDLFLFFGWFRNTLSIDGRLAFDRNDPHGRHIIFGYLQIGEVWKVTADASVPTWARYHPHTSPSRRERNNNTLYVARDHLSWRMSEPGFGVFRLAPNLVLTAPDATRSKWSLPNFFRETSISYHSRSSWKDGYFLSAAKGQEFVIDADDTVIEWAKELI